MFFKLRVNKKQVSHALSTRNLGIVETIVGPLMAGRVTEIEMADEEEVVEISSIQKIQETTSTRM